MRLFFGCKAKVGDSFGWRSILSSKEVVRAGACFKVGNGATIDPWEDPWVPWTLGNVIKLKKMSDGNDIWCVVDFINAENKEWKDDVNKLVCEIDMVEMIKRINLPRTTTFDKLLWTGS